MEKSLLDLPDYELIEVLKHVTDPKTLAALTEISPRFQYLISSSPEVMTNVTLHISVGNINRQFLENLKNSDHKYENVKFSDLTGLYFPGLEYLSKFIKRLKTVTFVNCILSRQLLAKLFSRTKNLETVKFERTKIEGSNKNGEVQKICEMLPKLKIVEIDWELKSIFQNYSFDDLQEMRISNGDFLSMKTMPVKLGVTMLKINDLGSHRCRFESTLMHAGPTLKYLEIDTHCNIELSAIKEILGKAKWLEEFHLKCSLLIRDTSDFLDCRKLKRFSMNQCPILNQVLTGMPALEHLTLNFPISNVFLRVIKNKCQKLKTLDISHNAPNILENIKFEKLENLSITRDQKDFNWEFLKNHPKIQNLQIHKFALSDADLKFILQSLPELKTLEIGNGEKLTAEIFNCQEFLNLKRIRIYKFNPVLKKFVQDMTNLRYYYEEKSEH